MDGSVTHKDAPCAQHHAFMYVTRCNNYTADLDEYYTLVKLQQPKKKTTQKTTQKSCRITTLAKKDLTHCSTLPLAAPPAAACYAHGAPHVGWPAYTVPAPAADPSPRTLLRLPGGCCTPTSAAPCLLVQVLGTLLVSLRWLLRWWVVVEMCSNRVGPRACVLCWSYVCRCCCGDCEQIVWGWCCDCRHGCRVRCGVL